MRILSWNLLRYGGAGVNDIQRLVEAHHPDLVLLQEVTGVIDTLPVVLGGSYVRQKMERRDHGLAAWSPHPFQTATLTLPLAIKCDVPPPLSRRAGHRIALIVCLDGLEIANVHLDHGQFTNRRQLRTLLSKRPRLDAIIGDYNAVGTTRLPGFTDVGPRSTTHRAKDLIPLRLDRCLVRGLRRTSAVALAYGASDHRPILVDLLPNCETGTGRTGAEAIPTLPEAELCRDGSA